MRKSRPHIAVMGASIYWVELVERILSDQDCVCEILRLQNRRQRWGWLLSRHWRRYDMIYHVGGTSTDFPNILVITLTGKPILWHWIGSDVTLLAEILQLRDWRSRLKQWVYRRARFHAADSPELVEELQAYDVSSTVIRLLPERIEAQVLPLPPIFTVLSYWSPGRQDFYRGEIVLKLAQEFPDVSFLILGVDRDDGPAAPANVRYLGFVEDVESVYAQSSVLIRLPQHDSLSAMALEMLARGRYVIYNKRIEGCRWAEDYESAKRALSEVRNMKNPNHAGARSVAAAFSRKREAEKMCRLCVKTIREGTKTGV